MAQSHPFSHQTPALMALIAIMSLTMLNANAQSGTLPVMHIETQNHQPITSKIIYIPG